MEDSSSENSFAWTDTSIDSLNSSLKDAFENHLKSSEKTDHNNQKMKNKENNCFFENQEDEDLITNVKEENNEMENMSNHKKKIVKLEPDSDNDLFQKKEKVNNFELNGNKNEDQNSVSYDETYLDMKVKQEEATISSSTKKKKGKKKRQSSVDLDSDISTTSTEATGRNHNALNSSGEVNNLQKTESDTRRTKSKKKTKKSKEIDHNSEDDIEDKVDIGETNICKQDFCKEKQDKHSKVNHSLRRKSHSIEEESDESGCNEISAIKCDNDITHTISFIDKSTTGKTYNNSSNGITLSGDLKQASNKEPDTNSSVADSTKQRIPRISERILFEDEENDNESSPVHDYMIDNSSNNNMKKTKQFLKGNPNLRLVTEQFYDSSNLTRDDEIWILKCPKEIEIRGFAGKNMNIHGKCKIKFDGQTYEGNAEKDIQYNTLTILTTEHNKYKIRNLPLNGLISLHKKIPKAHFNDDNIMVNNQTNFIPLPETKCRHPLFGSNYKKALKIPATIAERLNLQNSAEVTMKTEKKKKKKHKLDKNTVEQDNHKAQEPIMKTEPDLTMNVSEKKKKKKRKITDDEGPAPKKVKRIKHDPESAEAWESEKAIEENLFNY